MVRETKTGQPLPAHHQAQAVTTPVITAEIKTKQNCSARYTQCKNTAARNKRSANTKKKLQCEINSGEKKKQTASQKGCRAKRTAPRKNKLRGNQKHRRTTHTNKTVRHTELRCTKKTCSATNAAQTKLQRKTNSRATKLQCKYNNSANKTAMPSNAKTQL